MLSTLGNKSRVLLAPFHAYNALLERRPLLTKSLTSGIMYSGGDLLAQYTENINLNKNLQEGEAKVPLEINGKRCLIFFIFGTCVGGPAYHYWFNYLNELPALLWRMKQSRQRGSILRAYALLKSHNIEVKLDMAKLPKTEPLTKWKAKTAKILADQLIFSSVYTLVFFMSIGVLGGATDRLSVRHGTEEEEDDLLLTPEEGGLSHVIDKLTEFSREEVQSKVIKEVINKLQTHQVLTARGLSWGEIWERSWAHTKEVYWDTYIADCMVWPPLQLINFTFIPVRFQFLFVNFANLAWNTYLSLMANKKHG